MFNGPAPRGNLHAMLPVLIINADVLELDDQFDDQKKAEAIVGKTAEADMGTPTEHQPEQTAT